MFITNQESLKVKNFNIEPKKPKGKNKIAINNIEI